jgi:hypothetical protein
VISSFIQYTKHSSPTCKSNMQNDWEWPKFALSWILCGHRIRKTILNPDKWLYRVLLWSIWTNTLIIQDISPSLWSGCFYVYSGPKSYWLTYYVKTSTFCQPLTWMTRSMCPVCRTADSLTGHTDATQVRMKKWHEFTYILLFEVDWLYIQR